MMFLLCLSDSDRLLKNGHLLRFPHLSSLRRTVKYASGRLTHSPAWQEVASYSSRRHSQDFGRLPPTGFRKVQLASACLREAASAKAGPFLSNLGKNISTH